LILFSLHIQMVFAWLAKTSRECGTLSLEVLLAHAASLQGGWGRSDLSHSPKSCYKVGVVKRSRKGR
jgi:hypothetical protein